MYLHDMFKTVAGYDFPSKYGATTVSPTSGSVSFNWLSLIMCLTPSALNSTHIHTENKVKYW